MGQADRLAKRMTDAVLEKVASQSRPKVIVAYHGSPHSFDRFDASKIGTGEGAQAYGHGLYFAGDEDTAKHYKHSVKAGTEEQQAALYELEEKQGRLYETEQALRDHLEALASREGVAAPGWGDIKDPPDTPEARDLQRRLRYLKNEIDSVGQNMAFIWGDIYKRPGHMYEVELGVPEEALLNLDATMTQQSPEVLRALGRYAEAPRHFTLGQEGWAGKNAYMAAAPLGFGDAMSVASRRLLDAGIPGLSYWDGNSRSAAEGTRNYVMFPGTEDRIRILRKYGLLGPAAVGAAVGLDGQ